VSRCAYCEAPARHGSPVLGVWACASHAGDAREVLCAVVRAGNAWSERQQQHRRELALAGDALEAEHEEALW